MLSHHFLRPFGCTTIVALATDGCKLLGRLPRQRLRQMAVPVVPAEPVRQTQPGYAEPMMGRDDPLVSGLMKMVREELVNREVLMQEAQKAGNRLIPSR